VIALNDGIRHRILDDNRITADESLKADPAKLMHARISTDACPISDLDMSGERRRICHDYFVSKQAVVRNVCLCHQQIIIADPGCPAAAGRAAVDRHEFANMISFSDLGPGRFAGVFQVLRSEADRNERVNVRSVADLCISFDHDMRVKLYIVSEYNFRPNDTVRADAAIFPEFRVGANDRGFMD
jgi:hypothetical protein